MQYSVTLRTSSFVPSPQSTPARGKEASITVVPSVRDLSATDLLVDLGLARYPLDTW
jgi:hypothetical protein